MGLSRNGNRIGMAAHNEMQEFKEWVSEGRERFNQPVTDVLNQLREIDPDWEPWYDQEVPDWQDVAGRDRAVQMIQERIEQVLAARARKDEGATAHLARYGY